MRAYESALGLPPARAVRITGRRILCVDLVERRAAAYFLGIKSPGD